MMTRRQSLFCAGALVLVALPACVSRDAGYQDVRRTVAARTGHDLNWRSVDSSSVSERRTRELLAKPLTARTAVQVALYNNPAVQAAFEDLGISRAGIVEAFRLPNPTIDAALHYHGDGDPDLDLAVMEDISALLFLPVKNGAARADLEATTLAVAGAVMDLTLDVTRSYYRYQAARQVVEVRRTVLLAAKASYDASKSLHEAGNITDLDLANEQALYEEARLAEAQAETALVSERERLTSLMGLWGENARWTTAGRLPDPPDREVDVQAVEQRAIERSIDLDLARRRFAAAAKRANLGRAEGLLPELKAGVSFERDEGDWGVGPAAALEVPIFYQGQGAVARAEAEMRKQRSSHTAVAIAIRAAARSAVTRLIAARDRVFYYKRVLLPLRDRIVNETQLQYNAMNVGVFQLLVARRDQIETGRAYVEALRDYWIARAEVEQLLAGRLVRGFSEPAPIEMPRPAPAAQH
jgi:cobalt-zinc-cadmium efflux system outer membrane protein